MRHHARTLGLVLGLWAAPALAQQEPAAPPEPATDSSSAPEHHDYEVALSEALAAHARGDYALARVAMERAHTLSPSARTFRGLGIVAFAQGRHREAIDYLEQALASQEKPLSAELRSNVEELLGHAWGQVGRIQLSVDPATGDILVDGAAPRWHAPHEVVLTPGPHLITARAIARAPFELTLDVKPGEQRSLQIVLAVPPAALDTSAPGPRAEPALASAQRTPSRSPHRTARTIAYASGAAAVLSGAALWTTAYVRLQRIVTECENRIDGQCSPAYAENRYRAENVGGLGIAAALVGGAGLATVITTAALDLRDRQRREERNVAVGFSGSGVAVRGRF